MAKSNRGSKSRSKSSWRDKDTRRSCSRRQGTNLDESEYEEGKARKNDISWYSKNPDLLLAAGQFQYTYRPGMDILNNIKLRGSQYVSPQIESVLAIDWMPYVGYSADTKSAISIAAQEMYTKVRQAYTGELDADAPDMMMYIMALDSVFTYIGWLKRVYRALSTYSPDNMAFPTALLNASGITDAAAQAQLRRDKTRLWQGINELIRMTYRFKCPAVMDLFNRHYWLSDNVYTDANSTKAQVYVFNLIGVYKLNPLTPISGDTQSNTAAGLGYAPIPTLTSADPVAQLLNYGDDLIAALSTWSTGYTIAGYLQRAYAETQSFSVALLMQDELITATYSQEVLSQIENVQVLNAFGVEIASSTWSQLAVSQSVIDNAIVSGNSISVTLSETSSTLQGIQRQLANYKQYVNGGDTAVEPVQYVNIHADNPSPADTVIATRLHACCAYAPVYNSEGTSSSNITGFTCSFSAATELPVQLRLCVANLTVNSGMLKSSMVVPQVVLGSQGPQTTVTDILARILIARLDFFDWHPLIYEYMSPYSAQVTFVLHGDILSISTPSYDQIKNLNDVCVLSEFNAFAI